MIAPRRVIASSSRCCFHRRALVVPSADLFHAGSWQPSQPSALTTAQRHFGARIRRHADGQKEPMPEHSSSTSSGTTISSQLETATAAALAGDGTGVQHLSDIALSGSGEDADRAEEALLRVLREASGPQKDEIRSLCEASLQRCWHQSGDAEVDDSIRRGVALMDKDHHAEAEKVFTEVILKLPDWAEAYHKRATARFFLQDFDGALEDCEKCLEIKPSHFGCLPFGGMVHQRRGDLKEASRWFQKAADLHPGLEGDRGKAKSMEHQYLINEHLRPRIVSNVQALNDDSLLPANMPDGLSCSWDIVKEKSPEDSQESTCNYFLRVSLMNQEGGPSKIRSLARFYIFRFADGQMLPLTLLTEGNASFTLAPGEEYRFSWNLISKSELLRASGGMLLEHDEESKTLLDADFGSQSPSEATKDEVERMRLGYRNTGRLDLRRLSSVPQTAK